MTSVLMPDKRKFFDDETRIVIIYNYPFHRFLSLGAVAVKDAED